MQLKRVSLLLAIVTAALAVSPDDSTTIWLDLHCLNLPALLAASRVERSLAWKLAKPLIPNLSCRARGRVSVVSAGLLSLDWMEFNVARKGCDDLFFCREELVRITHREAGNATFYGFSSAWDTKISDCTRLMVGLHGAEHCFSIGDRRLLHMAFMLHPVPLLRSHL